MISLFMIVGTELVSAQVIAEETEEGLILKNEHQTLVFSMSDQYEFKSWKVGDKEILGAGTACWKATILGTQGENLTLTPGNGYYKGAVCENEKGLSRIRFVWELTLDGQKPSKVAMTVSLAEKSKLPEWNLEAFLPASWLVTETEFPRISFRRSPQTKAVLSPGHGAEYEIGTNGTLQSIYPSVTGSMQLMILHDPEGAWFFSTRDKSGATKYFQIQGQGESVLLYDRIITSYAWTDAEGHFEVPWATVAGYGQGMTWQQVALEWYRPFTFETRWGSKNVRERNIVKWVENADVWFRPMQVEEQTWSDLEKALEYYGKGAGIHWYYWHNYPFDTHYPEYFPAKPGFREMVQRAQRLGAHVTPYINGRLWDPATESYRTLNGAAASCRKPDGTLYTEIYGSKVLNTVTCPGSPIWQDILSDLNERILNELGTDGVYLDQVGCAKSEACYAEGHEHAKGAGSWWPEAYRKTLSSIRKEFYRKDQAMTTEENAECYIDQFDMMLTVNTPHSRWNKIVPLFALVYSDRCVYAGYTYIPWNHNDGAFDYVCMRSLLWGCQLGWDNPSLLMKPGNEKAASFLKTLVDFRKANHSIFFGGRYLAEIPLEGEVPQREIPGYHEMTPLVQAALWRDCKGREYYILVNMDSSDHDVILPDGRQVKICSRTVIKMKRFVE